MSTGNDKKILLLRTKIQEKKEKIGNVKFHPVTTCSIDLDGDRHNLHVLGKPQLEFLMIRLNSYRLSMVDLGIKDCIISGHSVNSWISDIKMKIAVLAQKEEEASLRAMESKLNALLSDDKKTELELTAIESMLS